MLPVWLVALGLSILIPALIVFVPLLIVTLLKNRRARRRRHGGSGDRRAAGAWDELLDQYGELGFAVPRRSTRTMVAEDLATQLPGDRPTALVEIARDTDDAVFSGCEVDAERSERIWTESLVATQVAREAVTTTRRLISRYRIRRRSRRR